MTDLNDFPLPNARGPQKKMGRKSLMTKEKADTIVDLLRRGNYITQAAAYVGITPNTILVWRNKGKELLEAQEAGRELDDTEQLFADFYLETEKARAEAEVRAVEVIRGAMGNQWQAAAWFLERTNNRDWGRTVKAEVTGEGGGPVQVDTEVVYRKLEALTQRHVVDAEVVEVKSVEPVTVASIKAAVADVLAYDEMLGSENEAEVAEQSGPEMAGSDGPLSRAEDFPTE